jgi:phosphoribosylformimino-5-aminoimidazole carboxamide ribonucleotide (ProFAR) isomerase
VVALSPHPIWVSGGITTTDELAYLEEIGAAGVVLGMALYTETLNVHDVATKWGGANTARDP